MILFCHGNNCIALYNEIRPQFDFLDRVLLFEYFKESLDLHH
jgi:hypothetical protein